ncbi:hypothetical protein OOZ54_13220 [Rhodopseudomonas palustris]|uniref:hypothetical protein n=1 Tax=Rhodopseudomonas palustris TaxID=1076 RepID=UPI0022F0A2BF|nr:hypothetical protein [Rhodopseudomonas palustris]WBU27624.1 hypothetical protein OOZ54_13220 [Rhodopseudomonas palustris]
MDVDGNSVLSEREDGTGCGFKIWVSLLCHGHSPLISELEGADALVCLVLSQFVTSAMMEPAIAMAAMAGKTRPTKNTTQE